MAWIPRVRARFAATPSHSFSMSHLRLARLVWCTSIGVLDQKLTFKVNALQGTPSLTNSESIWYILSMDLKQYFYRLTPPERDSFARRAGTTTRYIQCHLLTQRKIPRPALMRKLVWPVGMP